MTHEQVQKALNSAVREAFNLGMHTVKTKQNFAVQTEKAQHYATDLVMTQVSLALDQAREEGWIAAVQSADGARDADRT